MAGLAEELYLSQKKYKKQKSKTIQLVNRAGPGLTMSKHANYLAAQPLLT